MTKRCLDEGMLQAYLDGELSHERAAEAASHLTACDACAAALADAAQETSLFAAAFAPDEALSVPTEILRSRINASVAQLEASAEPSRSDSRGRSFGGFFASLAGLFSFTPQGAAAFASLLAVVALALVYFSAQKSEQTPGQTQDEQYMAKAGLESALPPVITQTPEPAQSPTPEIGATGILAHEYAHEMGNGQPTYVQAKHSPRPVKKRPAAPSAVKEDVLPGEKDYQTAIASLEKTIKLGGDESLRPAVRADYERNLALLDSAIQQTRQVAARNPKDEDAVGFLMSAYKSKVELLSKVADQAQVAALGR
ncbi:MAG TPA: zf-HC2 domain-containing protein [Pyrinomonadaceae bacterium]